MKHNTSHKYQMHEKCVLNSKRNIIISHAWITISYHLQMYIPNNNVSIS